MTEIVAVNWLEDCSSIPGRRKYFLFVTSSRPTSWHTLYYECWRFYLRAQGARKVKLTTYLFLVPMLRMHGDISTLPHTSSQRGA